MPTVPRYVGPQIESQRARGGNLQAPGPDGTAALARGLSEAADATERVAITQDSQAAFAAETGVKSRWLATDAELRKKYRGANVAGYQEEVAKFWEQARADSAETLSPRAQALIGKSLGVAKLQAQAGAQAYFTGETERAQDEAFNASQLAEIQRAAASGDPAVAATSQTLIKQRNAQQAALKGWSPEALEQANVKATTALHVNMIQDMQQRDPTAAMAYFKANKGDIDGTRHAEIDRTLNIASAGADGVKTAGDIWDKLGPKADGQPVELDKLEAAARERYANDKPRLDATVAQIRERATAFNSGEKERTAKNVNDVMLAYSQGVPLGRIMQTPAFTSLPGAEQAKIKQHAEDRQYAMMLRANAADARGEAAAARAERAIERKGYASMLDYSDPAKLATMSRDQVLALVPEIGQQNVGHLITRWDGMQKADGKLTATIDKQDFDHIADKFGFKPYAKKTDEQKADLGELQYRVEQLIDSAQKVKKAPLTREEKNELMRQELTRTVTVNPGLFSSNRDVPVVALKSGEVERVVVPQADRAQIVEALQAAYKRDPANALYEPTEANVRRLYLLNKSRGAAALLPVKNGQ